MIQSTDVCLSLWRKDIEDFLIKQIPRHYKSGSTADIGVGESTKILRKLLSDPFLSIDQFPDCKPDILFNVEDGDPDGIIKFDTIFMLEVMEHSKRPWKLAANIYKMLNPGGTVFVSVPCFLFWHPGYPFYGDYYRFLPGHEEILFEDMRLLHTSQSQNNIYGGKHTPLGMTYILRK